MEEVAHVRSDLTQASGLSYNPLRKPHVRPSIVRVELELSSSSSSCRLRKPTYLGGGVGFGADIEVMTISCAWAASLVCVGSDIAVKAVGKARMKAVAGDAMSDKNASNGIRSRVGIVNLRWC